MVALLVLRIWLADLLARCQGFCSVLGSIGELLCICVVCLETKESLTKIAALFLLYSWYSLAVSY